MRVIFPQSYNNKKKFNLVGNKRYIKNENYMKTLKNTYNIKLLMLLYKVRYELILRKII